MELVEAAIPRIREGFGRWIRAVVRMRSPWLEELDVIMGGAHVVAQRVNVLFKSPGKLRPDEVTDGRVWCACFDLPLRVVARGNGVRYVSTREWTDVERDALCADYVSWREEVLVPALTAGAERSPRLLAVARLIELGTLLDAPHDPLKGLMRAARQAGRAIPWGVLYRHVAETIGSTDRDHVGAYFLSTLMGDKDRVVVRNGTLTPNYGKAVDHVTNEIRKAVRREKLRGTEDFGEENDLDVLPQDGGAVREVPDAVAAVEDEALAARVRAALDAVCAERAAIPTKSSALAAVRKHAVMLFLDKTSIADVAEQEGCNRPNATTAWKSERANIAAEVRRRMGGAA